MARIGRVVVPDFPHHVVQRGVRRMDVFFSANDREEYLDLLSQSASKHALGFLAWCLMSNHAHFVVVPRQPKSLARTFGEAHRRYTRMINFREGWRGHLWQERFHSYPMDERHLVAAVRYVERNPVEAGLVERAEDWEWSSARYHLGVSTPDQLVREQSLFGLVNDWREYLAGPDGPDNTNYELHLRTGRPLGAADFLDQLEKLIGTSVRRRKGGWQKGKKRK
jgi:putative transposase